MKSPARSGGAVMAGQLNNNHKGSRMNVPKNEAGVVFKRVLVGPQEAQQLLDKHNTSNRNPSERHIDKLARQMSAGFYQETPVPIIISRTGVMLDGQHRLMAVIRSGKSVWFWLALGSDDMVQSVLDKPRVRTVASDLGLQGIKNNNAVASLIRYLAHWEGTGNFTGDALGTEESLAVLERWGRDRVLDIVSRSRSAPTSMRNAGVAAFLVLVSWAHPNKLDAALGIIVSGKGPEWLPLRRARESIVREGTRRNTPFKPAEVLARGFELSVAGEGQGLSRASGSKHALADLVERALDRITGA